MTAPNVKQQDKDQRQWDRDQQKLYLLSTWPVSQEAEKLCKLVKADRMPYSMPAALDLLAWAVDVAPQYHIDTKVAKSVLSELWYRSMNSPAKAVCMLFQLDAYDDPFEEGPSIISRGYRTKRKVAESIISYAVETARYYQID